MRENLEDIARDLELDASLDREPELKYESRWVHEAGNQTALLDGFAGHLREEDSLCLFYAKHVPFVEGKARAWLDMIERRDSGIHVDDKELKKHRNDIIRLHGILDAQMRVELENSIKADMTNVLNRLPGEDIEPKHLGSQRPLEAIVADLRSIYLP